MSDILVIGSSNTDMVINVQTLPTAGQTVLGGVFSTFAGGKGANQAVAARRAGAEVNFMLSVGDDDLGKAALDALNSEGINTDCSQVLSETASGVAMILVDANGENSIAVAPGANDGLSCDFLSENRQIFSAMSILLMQLEIPMKSVEKAVSIANENDLPVILNPAPAAELSDTLLKNLFCLTPNESEAEVLTGVTIIDLESAELAAGKLLNRGVQNVIITLGENGALLCDASGIYHQSADEVTVVDTTAAGDTFNGILATVLAEGQTLQEAMRLAVRGATLTVQAAGASASIPSRDQYGV